MNRNPLSLARWWHLLACFLLLAAAGPAQAASTNANLSGLSLSAGTLSPAFATATTAYTASVAYSVGFVSVAATLQDATAKLTVNGTLAVSGSASSPVALNLGSNVVSVVVTAQDGTTSKIYTITVTRAPVSANNASLTNLTLSAGSLLPTFSGSTTAYGVSVDNSVTSITVTPAAADSSASIRINGATVASGSPSGAIALIMGSTPIAIVVTSGDGTVTKSYAIVVTRAVLSADASLAGLGVAGADLSPTFASGTTAYTATVTNGGNSIAVIPILSDQTATLRIDGAAVANEATSAPIALNPGSNTVTILVTAADGTTTMLYTISVAMPAGTSHWAYLSPTVANVGSLPAMLDLSTDTAKAYLPSMTSTLSAALGATFGYLGQSASGAVMVGTASNANLAFMPEFYAGGSSQADGLYLRGTDQANIVTSGSYLTIAPAIYNLAQFAALLGGAQVSVDANGTVSATGGGTTYVVQPGYQVQVQAPTGTASLTTRSDGFFHFTDAAGYSQTLYPAFLEPDALGQALYSLTFVSSPMAEPGLNGTVTVQGIGGQTLTLVPDITLGSVPAAHAADAWWQDGSNHFRIQNVQHAGTSQGFTVK